MSFEPVKRTKVSSQVAGTIRDAIVSGGYRPGEPLPTERALAGQFRVNRSSVREALHRLEAWGLVEIRHGAGARVTDFLATAGLQLLPFLLAPGGQVDPKLLGDLLSLRVVLLGWTAEEAALRATPDSLARLSSILTELESTEATGRRQELDYDFFQELVAMTDNQVLAMLANGIRAVYLENRELFPLMYGTQFHSDHHRRTLEAVRSGDGAAARAAMADYASAALMGQP